ncbi:hypothetical protein DL89DRAFT_171833 [Linderina pennispora]|uniref:Malonyl-CoA:ACP transacylase (MAT) domain-containing protein n=1 Tax=Linderina pennispora TaxID=61395 RepID=A0A1Y1W6D9_9FUNG|nr:uncharacterized protein DL89DRAFT_171833 [Linderina pennispora]ORX69117.1 hypothetical protein DL89DRAFT_171833 [Linderina pennispora]
MVSVNPKKVGSGFDTSALQRVLDAIRERKSQLLEIVNYNIQGVQYVVAGHTESLGLMGQILDVLSSKDTLDGYLHDNPSISAVVQEVLAVDTAVYGLQSSGATTVLNGIDLPYHSSLLEPTVSAFREFLDQVLPKNPDIFENLYNRYIPNMTGTPFDVSQKFMKQVYDVSHSSVVSKLLDSWDDNSHYNQGQVSSCARLLLIELLSFQIARPVMWIETQNTVLIRSCVSRLIEIGPNRNTLSNGSAYTSAVVYHR